jgi:hypothetical protein
MKRTSSFCGGRGGITAESTSIDDSTSSPDKRFGSDDSGVAGFPTAGDASRDAVAPGSRFAVRAAFNRFSASSLAIRSCSCIASAEVYKIR